MMDCFLLAVLTKVLYYAELRLGTGTQDWGGNASQLVKNVRRLLEWGFCALFHRGVHSIVRRLRTNPPREINLRFFLFFFSHRGLVSHKWIESEWVWQAFFCETRTQKIAFVKLENCGGGRGRVGRGPGKPSRSRSPEARCERGAQSIAVRVIEAMWRLKPDYQKEKNMKDRAIFWELGWSSVEALGLRFWRLTPFDGQYNAVNLSLRTRVTPWHRRRLGICRTRQILVSCRTSLWKVAEGRKDRSLLLELNLWNVMTMRPGRDNHLGNVLCSCTHARHLVGARCCGSACMPYPDPCRQLWVSECLAEADSCRCWTEESWKEPHGYMEFACKFSPSGI